MKLRSIFLAVTIFLMCSGLTALAAHPEEGSPPPPPKPPKEAKRLTPEQEKRFHELRKIHEEKMFSIMNKLEARHLEVRELKNIQNISFQELRALTDEIISLRSEAHKEKNSFFEALEKEGIPLPKEPCFGMMPMPFMHMDMSEHGDMRPHKQNNEGCMHGHPEPRKKKVHDMGMPKPESN